MNKRSVLSMTISSHRIHTLFLAMLVCILLRQESLQAAETESSSFFNFSWVGTEALRNGDFKTSIKETLADSAVSDTAFRLFKLGVINAKLKNESKALFYFRLTAQKSIYLAPFAYEYIGDLETESKQLKNALNAYRTAISYSIPSKYRNHVFGKIRYIVDNDSSELVQGPWLDEFRQWLIPQLKAAPTSSYDLIDSLISSDSFSAFDSILQIALNKDPEQCRIVQRIENAAIPDSVLSTKTIFRCAQTAYSCKENESSEKLLRRAKARKDFDKTIPLKTSLYFEAKLYYAMGELTKAISLFKKYQDKYGPDSELLMTVARAYRKLDNDEAAYKWYDMHVKLYPKHPKTKEILWLMAWRMELTDKYKEAANYYKRIYTGSRDGSRAEESYIRHALCYYKLEKYDTTISVLNTFIKKLPISEFNITARFWKAKSFLAIDKLDSARFHFKEISTVEPYDYYANRSRQILLLLGDTTEYAIDTISDTLKTLHWLDSITPVSPKKSLTFGDSTNLYRGIALSLIGQVEEADFFLGPLEQSFPGNLELQFKLALIYQKVHAPKQAFRVARRLSWRIPQESRNDLPFLVYKLLYPPFYADAIKYESASRNVDPFLVSSVIRQESIFNHTIVSPAGAIGLMQIMPFTGKAVATRHGDAFTVDSLYKPFTNIRYGTSYLRELLDEFNENLVLAIAGYNGGPHNAKRWYNHNKTEEYDLFIEDIEFTETRGYVKKVLANYWTYRLLAKTSSYTYGSSTDNYPVVFSNPFDSTTPKQNR